MTGLGTIINCIGVLLGCAVGLLFGRALKQSYQDIMTKACGLSTMFIGAAGTFEHMLTVEGGKIGTTGSIMLVITLCLGGLIGEIADIEGRIERFGQWLKVKSHSERDPMFIEGFTTASFTICIGAMAIIGPMNDALHHDVSLLITKAILDAIIIMAMAASLGRGTVFSVIPLGIWQGLMTLLACVAGPMMSDAAIGRLSLVGNSLIFCVGLNLLVGKKVKVANLLPSLIFAVAWVVPI